MLKARVSFKHEIISTPQPIGEAARLLGVCPDSLRRWFRRGILPDNAVTATAGGHRRFRVDLIASWMEEQARRLSGEGE